MQKTIQSMCLVFLFITIFSTSSSVEALARYRGFTVCYYDYKTLKELKDKWHANQVRFMICPAWRKYSLGVTTNKAAMEKLVSKIPELLENCRKLDLAVIIDLHQSPNDFHPKVNRKFKSAIEKRNYRSNLWWNSEENYKALEDAWKTLASISAKYPKQKIWLELFNEPLNWADFPHAPKAWNVWAQKLVNVIRKIDKTHPILVATGPGQLWYGFSGWRKINDPSDNIIYTFHMWQPFLYTHQGVSCNEIKGWPNNFNDGSGGFWDKKRIISALHQVRDFQKKTKCRIHVGEFGVARYAPDGAKYLDEVIDIFEKNGWDWNCHGIKEAPVWSIEYDNVAHVYKMNGNKKEVSWQPVKDGMTTKQKMRYMPYGGIDKKRFVKDGLSDRGKVILKYMSRNLKEEKPFSAKDIRSVLVIGNSLTRHAPRTDIGWHFNHGMGATKPELDYVHLFYNQLCHYTKSKPKLYYGRVIDEAHLRGICFPLPEIADIVILQIGENFRGKCTKAGVQVPYGKLVDKLKGLYPHAKIFCIGSWRKGYGPFIKAAAKEHGADFVDITAISKIDTNSAKADGKFARWEIQWHPGNNGMREIAKCLWTSVKKRLNESSSKLATAQK